MSRQSIAGLLAVAVLSVASQAHATEGVWPPPSDAPRKKTLTAFASEADLNQYLKRFVEAQQRRERRSQAAGAAKSMADAAVPSVAAPAAAPMAAEQSKPAALAKSGDSGESVTNTQTAGVDEGGIVKVHGKHLVMLRRGRLFTVNIERGDLRPVSAIDAFDPATGGAGSWYDEMLISDNTVVVIGYSYGRGGTEIGLFDIDAAGKLSYRATYHMRSNDYYSSRNYASRLIGNKLIFYTPLYLNLWSHNWHDSFPAVRRWRPGVTPADFQRIAPATRIYRTDDEVDPDAGLALHTVSICDLGKREMECEATGVLGPQGRVFYVSADSVYVWTSTQRWNNNELRVRSGVFRIPLSGKAPTALKVQGAPVDQFSFLESPDQHLNVLVRSQGRGDGMWASERGRGELALLRVPLSAFSDGRDSARSEYYKPLPTPAGHSLQNRYIGSWLIYGTGSGWGRQRNPAENNAYAVRWDSTAHPQSLRLPHNVDRIEALGNDAVVIGSAGRDLHFTSFDLGREAVMAHSYVREDASQGETRSHGFFYKPETEDSGMIGLPIMHAGQPGHRQLRTPSASVLFLKNTALKLDELGPLSSDPQAGMNDNCKASCVDWYGNSRPLFVRNRIFALMGYELVEGRVVHGRMIETRRISYAPTPDRMGR